MASGPQVNRGGGPSGVFEVGRGTAATHGHTPGYKRLIPKHHSPRDREVEGGTRRVPGR